VLFALSAAREAVDDAGLDGAYDPGRVGILFGSAIGGFLGIMEQAEVLRTRGPTRVTPTFIPSVLVDAASGQLAISLGFRGPNYAPVSACATGSHAIGEAAELIRRGDADAVLAGGAEACIHPLPLAGFAQARAYSTRNDEPERASRPFDTDRDGFVVVVLERAEFAAARVARPHALLAGAGVTSDAHHITAWNRSGQVRAMGRALDEAGLPPTAIDHIHAHATSTQLGDLVEAESITEAIGVHPAVTATKSMTGHLFGAAGAMVVDHEVSDASLGVSAASRAANFMINNQPAVRADKEIRPQPRFGACQTRPCRGYSIERDTRSATAEPSSRSVIQSPRSRPEVSAPQVIRSPSSTTRSSITSPTYGRRSS
jgi:3-oxoacyl-[acyl-carrier-protein] synthase II